MNVQSHFHKSGFVRLSDSTIGKLLLGSLYFNGRYSRELSLTDSKVATTI